MVYIHLFLGPVSVLCDIIISLNCIFCFLNLIFASVVIKLSTEFECVSDLMFQ